MSVYLSCFVHNFICHSMLMLFYKKKSIHSFIRKEIFPFIILWYYLKTSIYKRKYFTIKGPPPTPPIVMHSLPLEGDLWLTETLTPLSPDITLRLFGLDRPLLTDCCGLIVDTLLVDERLSILVLLTTSNCSGLSLAKWKLATSCLILFIMSLGRSRSSGTFCCECKMIQLYFY